jgi:hypothetical protein
LSEEFLKNEKPEDENKTSGEKDRLGNEQYYKHPQNAADQGAVPYPMFPPGMMNAGMGGMPLYYPIPVIPVKDENGNITYQYPIMTPQGMMDSQGNPVPFFTPQMQGQEGDKPYPQGSSPMPEPETEDFPKEEEPYEDYDDEQSAEEKRKRQEALEQSRAMSYEESMEKLMSSIGSIWNKSTDESKDLENPIDTDQESEDYRAPVPEREEQPKTDERLTNEQTYQSYEEKPAQPEKREQVQAAQPPLPEIPENKDPWEEDTAFKSHEAEESQEQKDISDDEDEKAKDREYWKFMNNILDRFDNVDQNRIKSGENIIIVPENEGAKKESEGSNKKEEVRAQEAEKEDLHEDILQNFGREVSKSQKNYLGGLGDYGKKQQKESIFKKLFGKL